MGVELIDDVRDGGGNKLLGEFEVFCWEKARGGEGEEEEEEESRLNHYRKKIVGTLQNAV